MLLHLIFLSTATLLTWLWTTTEALNFYTLQLSAILIIVYFFKNAGKQESRKAGRQKALDAVILTMVVLLLIFSTGGASSPLFFLSYFLLFGISFLFEPKLSIVYSVILIIFFAFESGGNPSSLIKVFSLILVSPLALFFGQQFLQTLADKNRIKIYQDKWLTNEKSLENEETSSLLWLSLNLKEKLAEISEISANLLINISSLSPHQVHSIQKIKEKADTLLAESDELKRELDEETD